MSWDGNQIESLAIVLRDLDRRGIVSELRRLADAIEKSNELKEKELSLVLKDKISK